jgi:hypothetical protein
MNSVVLGALIGAMPGTVAAALATWVSIRTGKLTLEREQVAHTVEHAIWLREKRSDVYVEGIRFLHEASVRRANLIKSGMESTLLRSEVVSILNSYAELSWHDRLARAEAYLPEDASSVYLAAAEGDWGIWRNVHETVMNTEQRLIVTDGLADDLKQANLAFREFRDLARRDLLRRPSNGNP